MPIYEYHCPECDNLFEEWCQRIDDEKSKPCPQCGKTAERIISQTSFALKGEGWYVTEYGSKKGVSESSGTDSVADSGASKTSAEPATNTATGSTANTQNASAASTSSSGTSGTSGSSQGASAGPAS